jgi:hypothetical protein
MRRSPRTLLLALLVAVVALGGCGGSEIDADEVPGATPTLTVPSDSELNSGSTSDEDAASTDEDAATTEDAAAEDTTADTEAAATGRRDDRRHDHARSDGDRRAAGLRGDGHAAPSRLGGAAVRGLLRPERRRLLTRRSTARQEKRRAAE